ncbi:MULTISPECIES: PEP-CTERM sorting domain-containing protein [unclassified Lentimonas]|uniref:PEP-CTERM sorting domain-containing protein n=1 Tax=unclassified Lentimonas TaxID=2630993 RepID=UPI00132795CF|nr:MULTISPECIES: PEP-CTERM sorting domain-containing protein [unclassified Lentimonas]CAA6679662.1 Unannotated [Lentimonas sp. CC4]CAA6683571.1 Unannotated [Lentimonas sp. CC6]CAA7077333.1 Unannotated [Lentimonas sp. CC4]CAA7170152.1 Unannotated [Lentimonas sp. CC21]CAA7182461.1 Unannotated [Lentimonas sp. CC8]
MKKLLSLFTLTALGAGAAQADTVVEWGAPSGATDIVTATQELGTGADPDIDTPTTYSSGHVASPVVGADYYPNNTGKSPTFNWAGSTTGAGNTQIFNPGNAANPDQIQFVTGNNDDPNFDGMIVWENFVTAPTTDLASFTTSIYRTGSGDLSGNLKFIFQDSADNWFASSDDFVIATGFDTRTLNVTGSTEWLAFTPHVSGDATIGAVASPASLSDVQAVGFYFDITKDGVAGKNAGVSLQHFGVSTVPEPGAFALIAGSLALGFVMVRRRK